MTIKELKEKRAGLVANMRASLDKARASGRDLNTEEQSSYDKMDAEVSALTTAIQREENLATIEARLTAERDDKGYRPTVDAKQGGKKRTASAEYKDAFCTYFRHGINNSLETGVDADGGFLVPESFEREIVKLKENLDPMRVLADVRMSATLANIPVQAGRATFAWLGENGTYGQTNPTLGRVVLSAHKMGGMILASDEVLLDADADITGFITGAAANASALLEAEAFLVGTGANQPLGLFSTVSVGGLSVADQTGAISATATLTADDLLDTVHALKQVYRPGAAWLLRDATLKAIRKLKSNDSQYIWQPGISAGQPDRLLGYPVYTSDYAPAMAVSTRSIAFGNFKGYRIHDRLGSQVLRLNELYAGTGQVAWRFTSRTDGKLVDPNSVVFFKHGAAS